MDGAWQHHRVSFNYVGFTTLYTCDGLEDVVRKILKDLITKNFSLRNTDYRTDCFPHDVTLDDFSVKGQALRAVPAVARSAGAVGAALPARTAPTPVVEG